MPELFITDLNDDGQGVARLDDFVVFVDGALPGETVDADLFSRRKHYALAAVREIIIPSPERIDPECPHFHVCGGCTLCSMKYRAQLRYKTDMVREKLLRIGGFAEGEFDVEPTVGMEYPYYFRNKITFPISGKPSDPRIGMYERGTHNVVPVRDCKIQHPVAGRIIPVIRDYTRAHRLSIYNEKTRRGFIRHLVVRVSYTTGQVMVVLVTKSGTLPDVEGLVSLLQAAVDGFKPKPLRHPPCTLHSVYQNIQNRKNNVILGEECILLYGEACIEEQLFGISYFISPLSFFQTNTVQAEALFREVIGATVLNDEQTVLDLYCGAGAISLQIARRAAKVIGVDVVPEAIRDAVQAAERAGLEAVTQFVAAAAEDWYAAYADAGGRCHLVVLDPPRKGCSEALLHALLESPPARLIYVSCDPGTLARDLGVLKEEYRVCKVQPVDMFPWTTHVETVVLLARLADRPKTKFERLCKQWEEVFEEEEHWLEVEKKINRLFEEK